MIEPESESCYNLIRLGAVIIAAAAKEKTWMVALQFRQGNV